jgi:putative ABC transport system permease protein
MMENFLHDVGSGFRLLLKRPGFTIIVVLVLALCVGANTAIFSLVNAILLRPLDYQNPERLVRVWAADTAHGFPESELSPPDIYDIRNQTQTLEAPSAFYAKRATLTGTGEPLRLKSVLVSPSFFNVLGVQPAVGRFFVNEEEQEGKDRVAILGYKFWQERFNGNPKVIGETLILDDVSYQVVGVLPPKFEYLVAGLGAEPQVWQPLTLDLDPNARSSHLLDAIARLKPGVSLQQAQSEMSNIARRLEEQYPDSN